MRFETHSVRIGEWLGPVDWSYDFGGSLLAQQHPAVEAKARDLLRQAEAALGEGHTVHAGLQHTFGWTEILCAGMYDGWPFWQPTPALQISSPMGGVEQAFWYALRSLRVTERPSSSTAKHQPDQNGGRS